MHSATLKSYFHFSVSSPFSLKLFSTVAQAWQFTSPMHVVWLYKSDHNRRVTQLWTKSHQNHRVSMHNIMSCIHSKVSSRFSNKKTLMYTFSQKFGCAWTEFVSQDLKNLLIWRFKRTFHPKMKSLSLYTLRSLQTMHFFILFYFILSN